jgi:LPS sulfotransferase NodH
LRQPIFILGAPRSGTTLLNDILAHHPHAAVLSEANDIWDPSGYPWHLSAQETPPVWADPTAYTARWWRDAQARAGHIRAVFGAYQSINKSPMNTFRVPYLLQMFPEARFIHIVRDGRAVVQSHLRRTLRQIEAAPQAHQRYGIYPDSATIALQLAHFWRQNVEEVARQADAFGLGADRLFHITYEQLCADPQSALNSICAFLGLDAAALPPSIWDMPIVNQNHKWRQVFSPQEAQRLSAEMQPTLAQWGYA